MVSHVCFNPRKTIVLMQRTWQIATCLAHNPDRSTLGFLAPGSTNDQIVFQARRAAALIAFLDLVSCCKVLHMRDTWDFVHHSLRCFLSTVLANKRVWNPNLVPEHHLEAQAECADIWLSVTRNTTSPISNVPLPQS